VSMWLLVKRFFLPLECAIVFVSELLGVSFHSQLVTRPVSYRYRR